MKSKDMFEAYYSGELSKETREKIESFANINCGGIINKWWFLIGWIMRERLEEIKEELGTDED